MLADVAVIAAVLGFWVVWILGIVRALRTPPPAYEAAGRRKPSTVMFVVFLGCVGAAYFLLVVQRELAAAIDPPTSDPATSDPGGATA